MRQFLLHVFFVSILACQSVSASQVVLVTGASRGIGLEIASLLAKDGYTVYAGMRAKSNKDQLMEMQQRYPKNLHLVELDVTDQDSVDAVVKQIVNTDGRIDVLVNNAGIGISGSVENVSIEEAQTIFDVNFFGVMRTAQAVLPHMRAQKSGRIIQISSRSGFRPLPSLSVYAASKFALEGLSETMASTLKPWNIHVSMIEPGPVATNMMSLGYGSRLSSDKDPYSALFEAGAPDLSREQAPIEIAELVKTAMTAERPLFRYQTTNEIRAQAAQRFVDVTGLSQITEWHDILFQ